MWVVRSCGARERSARRSARARALCTPLGQPALQNSPHSTASLSMGMDFWQSSDGSSGRYLQAALRDLARVALPQDHRLQRHEKDVQVQQGQQDGVAQLREDVVGHRLEREAHQVVEYVEDDHPVHG